MPDSLNKFTTPEELADFLLSLDMSFLNEAIQIARGKNRQKIDLAFLKNQRISLG
jgi:hypothetical protein